MTDDPQLNRLFEYTKFHIGIYLTIGGGLVTLLGAGKDGGWAYKLIGCPMLLLVGLVLMTCAGAAGGVIASSTTTCKTFDELWKGQQGPYRWKVFTGETWGQIEHVSFWLAVVAIAGSVLCSRDLWRWIATGH